VNRGVSTVLVVLPGPERSPDVPMRVYGDGRTVMSPSFGQLIHQLMDMVTEARRQSGRRLPVAVATGGRVGREESADGADAALLERDEAASDEAWRYSEAADAAWRRRGLPGRGECRHHRLCRGGARHTRKAAMRA